MNNKGEKYNINKIFIGTIISTAILSVAITLLFLFLTSLFPVDLSIDLDLLGTYLNSIFSAVLVLVSVVLIVVNTNRQIEAQREDVKLQIENQNRQNNMPHLTIEDVISFDTKEESSEYEIQYLDGYKLLMKKIDKKKDDTVHFYSENVTDRFFAMCFKNIGYGVASDIVFYNVNTNKIIGAYKMGFGKGFATKEIAKDGCDKFLFEMKCFFGKEEENDDFIELIILYSDLNMNIRALYASVAFSYDGDLSYTFYQENSYKYTKKLNNLKIKKSNLVKKYSDRKINDK